MIKRKSNSRREEIIQAAVKILIEKGHGALSIDNIAKSLSISKGNVTYHYPSKDLIVRSLFDYLMDELDERRAKALSKFSEDPLERFTQYINFEVSSKRRPNYDAQSWETYAFSSHNLYVRKRLNEVIDSSIDALTDILFALKPELGYEECKQRSIMINATLRGMMLFIGSTRGNKKQHKILAERTRRTAFLIAEGDVSEI